MMLASQSTLPPSSATRPVWPTWFVNPTVLDQVSWEWYILFDNSLVSTETKCVIRPYHFLRDQQEGDRRGCDHHRDATNGVRWCGWLHRNSSWSPRSAHCLGRAHVRGLPSSVLQELVNIYLIIWCKTNLKIPAFLLLFLLFWCIFTMFLIKIYSSPLGNESSMLNMPSAYCYQLVSAQRWGLLVFSYSRQFMIHQVQMQEEGIH